MAEPKLVSVIIPVFNTGEAAIKMALSLLKGNYKKLEIIFVDDGSTDESYSLLKEFKRQYELRSKREKKTFAKILLIQQENGGAASARNAGLAKATGEYICFVDSDDTVQPKFISTLVSALEQYDEYDSRDLQIALASTAISYHRVKNDHITDIYTNDLKSQLPNEDFIAYILRLLQTDGRLHSVFNKLFRHNIIKHFNLRFDEKVNFGEDLKFVLDYLKVSHQVHMKRISFVLEPLYFYNYGTKTSTVSLSSLSWGNWQKSFQNLSNWVGKNPDRTHAKLLYKIYLRWRLSHALAVARSSQSFGHKCQHASPVLVIPALVVVKLRR